MINDLCIITIGNEIQKGITEDTNRVFLSRYLDKRGYNVLYSISVSDDYLSISDCLAFCYDKCRAVITTGGLGPTSDDITRNAVADYFNKPLIEDLEEKERILSVLKSKRADHLKCNMKQAFFPEGSELIKNVGYTASGFVLRSMGNICISLPGVPSELRKLVIDGSVDRHLPESSKSKSALHYIVYNYRESEAESILQSSGDYLMGANYSIICNYKMILLIFYPLSSEFMHYDLDNRLYELFGKENIIRASGIYEALYLLIKDRGLSVSFAESATGGFLSNMFTRISGISEVFSGSIVSYSNESKICLLGVNECDIKSFGAVSEPVSVQMARGVRKAFNSDLGLGITGIAGPTGETPDKPLGLFYISLSFKDKIMTEKFILDGDRFTRQQGAAARAVYMMVRMILNTDKV